MYDAVGALRALPKDRDIFHASDHRLGFQSLEWFGRSFTPDQRDDLVSMVL